MSTLLALIGVCRNFAERRFPTRHTCHHLVQHLFGRTTFLRQNERRLLLYIAFPSNKAKKKLLALTSRIRRHRISSRL